MPITSTFDPTHNVAIVTVTSPYTVDEWRSAVDQILSSRPGPTCFLVDCRRAGIPTTNLVDEIVTHVRANADQLSSSFAAVLVGGEAAFGIARKLAIRTEVGQVPLTIKVFVDYDDAVRWLTSTGPG